MSAGAGQLANNFGFTFAIRLAIRMKHFVKPYWWGLQNVGLFPRIPRQVRLRFAGNQAPVNGCDMVSLGDGQNCVEGAADRTRHKFSAQNWTMVGFQPTHVLLKILGPVVIVEGKYVRLLELNSSNCVQLVLGLPVSLSQAAGQRLGWVSRARPGENFGQE